MNWRRRFALLGALADTFRSPVRLPGEYVVGGMATMPTRKRTFPRALASLARQVDKVYVYLDGFTEVPEAARSHPNVVPILSSEYPGLRANGKLLGLVLEPKPCLYVCADDDIQFHHDFVAKLRRGLGEYDDRAVVGFHGSHLARPFERYFIGRKTVEYDEVLDKSRLVDVLGTGAVMFNSSVLKFDVRDWPYPNMADIGTSLEAAKAGIPAIMLGRKHRCLSLLETFQQDSLGRARRKDDTTQTILGRQLVDLRDAANQRA